MSVNWISLLAAIANLFVLYLILKRYLFGPLLKIMKDQQEQWERREKELEHKELELVSKEQALEHERTELEYEVRQYYQQAMSEIELFKESELANARKKAESLYNRIVSAAKSEADKIRQEAIENAESWLRAAVEKVCAAFVGDVRVGCLLVDLVESKTEEIRPLLTPGKAYAFVSSHELTQEERLRVQAMSEALGINVSEFHADPSMILGFRFTWKAEMIEYSLAQVVKEHLKLSPAAIEPVTGEGGEPR